MNKEFTVSIIIPNYNGERLLEKNLPYVLRAKENPENRILEIIVVDDGSIDNSTSLIKNKFPEVRLYRHKINRGFSAAVNLGVRMAKGDLVLLLNTDVIPSTNFLVSVLPHFEKESVFGVSLHEKDYVWAKGFFADGYIQIGPGKKGDKPHISFWVSGGSGVFRRSYWIALGGMDEKLLSPFYWEDIDICYRAAKRGWEILWEPDAIVEHKHESTISKFPKSYVERIRERNQLLFNWKNLTSPPLFRRHLVGILKRLVKHPGYIRVLIMALGRLNTALKARKKEIREAKISDETIFSRFKK
jgi:GT2 family glycosyltransferase